MKKVVSLLLGLLMLFAACTAMADTVVTVKPGEELTMEVSIVSASGKSAKIGISTNNAPVTFVSATGGSVNDTVPPQAFNDYFDVVNVDDVTIKPDGSGLSGDVVALRDLEDGVIGKLNFKVNANAAAGTYTVEAVKKSGSVTVVGSVTFTVEADEVGDKLLGDVNGDGKVDGRDSVRLMNYLVAMDEEDPVVSVTIVEVNTDLNEDGRIDGRDSVRLANLLVSMDE